jgi:hypothetical protein
MGSKVKGPRLFKTHDPVVNTETQVTWEIGGRRFRVIDLGRSWAFEALATLSGGFASKHAAKRGLERHVRRELNLLAEVMGVA